MTPLPSVTVTLMGPDASTQVQFILDEIIMGGMVLETNINEIIHANEAMNEREVQVILLTQFARLACAWPTGGFTVRFCKTIHLYYHTMIVYTTILGLFI